MKRILTKAISLSRNPSGFPSNRGSARGRLGSSVRVAGLVLLAAAWAASAYGQAPAVLWSTNIGARLFAVDAQTNVYANVGGTVIKLSGDGVPLQTNAICPLPGIAQQDAAGNFYFAGSFDGTQNFGGITLVGGCTYCNWDTPSAYRYSPGMPTCFLAKYGSSGSLQWVSSFGRQRNVNSFHDLQADASGDCYAAYSCFVDGYTPKAFVIRFSNLGTNLWEADLGPPPLHAMARAIRLGGLTESGCSYNIFSGVRPPVGQGGRIDVAGNPSRLVGYPLNLLSDAGMNSKPVIDNLGQLFQVGRCFSSEIDPPCAANNLRKYGASDTMIWSQEITTNAQWTLARDEQSSVYLAGTNGMIAKYDNDGWLVWSNNVSGMVVAMIVDASGNRFLSFDDGRIARLAAEPLPVAPTITADPQSVTVFVGDSVSLFVTATGTLPLRYAWRLNGDPIAGTTDSTYSFSGATPAQAGSYTAVVTNIAGARTSAPALVRIKSVQLYLGSQMLTNGTYVFTTPPALTVRSAFLNGSVFYTLDGSPPSFASTFYTGAIPLPQSATVRAIGYSADFTQSEEADVVTATVLVNHTLAASASSGGSVTLSPPGGTYLSTNTVLATGVPAPGWSFLYWLGDATGTNPSLNVTMERDKALHAVFVTTLATTVAGNGQVLLDPPGGVYPYGTTVRLTAVPQPGNYFGFWGNAATGNTNPLYFTVTAPTQTVSSIFGATPGGQAALTVQVAGRGRVNRSPQANAYTLNQAVTLTAVPEAGLTFVGWSSDASGTQNPLVLTMDGAKVVTATFTARPSLRADRPGIEGLTSAGFRFTLASDPASVYDILGSTNLSSWETVGRVTNLFGEVQFTDPAATGSSQKFYQAKP